MANKLRQPHRTLRTQDTKQVYTLWQPHKKQKTQNP